VFVGEPERKKPLGDMHWIQLAQDRVQWWAAVDLVMNLWVL